jgi:hypothetical protein
LQLENISYDDKIWVAMKVLNKNQLITFAMHCALSVLNVFENKFPFDKRPRQLLEYMGTITDFEQMDDGTKAELEKLRRECCVATYAVAAAYAIDAAAYTAYASAVYAYMSDAAAIDAAIEAAYTAVYATADIITYAYAKQQQGLNLIYLSMVA